VSRDRRDGVLQQCAGLAGVELCYPFGDDVAVFKVGGKMFAIVSLGRDAGAATLKCDPEEAAALRGSHDGITAGYHMSKRHWITVDLAAQLPTGLVRQLVEGSYELVVASLPAQLRPAPA
jgi:predicted DNA-binding protein (MmcQ/YjbR family)